ncbi:MAG TPA: nuclear transport factor 2 family protein [Acidimicrobiales bacterium]|nr:nuclear transport factor 2 family protein [Acidimicrobiales bacterium]
MGDDAREIENLIVEYAELIDAGDFEGVGTLLGDASFGGANQGSVRGADAIASLFGSTVRRYEDGTPRTKHVTTNVHVEVEENGRLARARSYVTVFQALPDFPLQPIVAGRYRDRFECVDGAWRFVERLFVTDLVGDVSRHLRAGPEILR